MRSVLRSLIFAVLFIAACDALVGAGLAHPGAAARLPRPVRMLLRGVYLDGGRNIVQYEPASARWDAGLSYTLKPGNSTFANAEFSTPLHVNSLGVRDDESALERPELIVLGDSRAMGWGILDEERYSEILAEKTGLRTLNACVSSYGTVREMRLLDRIDASSARTIVVHYVENDDEENKAFFKGDDRLPAMSAATYEEARKRYESSKRRYFGKYTALLLLRIAAEARDALLRAAGMDHDRSRGDYFMNALLDAGRTTLDGKRLVIVGDGDFVKRLKELIAAHDYPAYVEKAVLVSDDLPESGYFTLDNHPNAAGHRLLADRLATVLR